MLSQKFVPVYIILFNEIFLGDFFRECVNLVVLFKNSALLIGTSSTSKDLQADASLDSTSSSTTHSLLDIGLCLDFIYHVDDDLRLKLLRYPWKPRKTYNFKNDVNLDAKRAFRYE
jgi:hypothetical protein